MNHEATTQLPTEFGTFAMHVFRNQEGEELSAICAGNVNGKTNLPVRVHSACFTAEALGSLKCDCKQQLNYALQYIAEHGGAVLYLPQEGRGIGLSNKIKAYALQERGHDTIEANRLLGLPIDGRSYEDAKDILAHLGVQSIKLLTNNPDKLHNLKELGVHVEGRLPVICDANKHSAAYLETKQKQMGHMLKEKSPNSRVVSIRSNQFSKRPFVHVNFAITVESKMADDDGEQIIISCDQDWKRVHELREKYSAVAVGAKTWLKDNPRLTARQGVLGRKAVSQPARVVFAGSHNCHIGMESCERPTFVIGSPQSEEANTHVSIVSQNHDLASPLGRLRERGIESVLVEGGHKLITSFISQGMVDLLTIYVRTQNLQAAKDSLMKVLPHVLPEQIQAEEYGEGMLLTVAKSAISLGDAREVV